MATGSVFFVHGSGNRTPDAVAYGAKLTAGLGLRPNTLRLSTWGDAAGPNASFPRLPLTMPTVSAAFGESTSGSEALIADPYAPLRELAGGQGAFAVGGAKAEAKAMLAFLEYGGFDLSGTGVTADQVAAAAAEVSASPEFAAAGGDPVRIIDAAVSAAIARAIQLQGPEALDSGAFGLPDFGKIKEGVVDAFMSGVGMLVDAAGKVSGPIAKWISEQIAPRRAELMQKHVLVAADVLFYQRHSAAIRRHVREEIRALPAPRVVLGHSLGGIILVDTLFGRNAVDLDIDLLVTFGSQSPLLEALEAFDRVKPTAPWLNIWTRFDFVSFLAAGLWPGKVTDHEIEVDVGFPEAHGAYYDSKAFYAAIKAHPGFAGHAP